LLVAATFIKLLGHTDTNCLLKRIQTYCSDRIDKPQNHVLYFITYERGNAGFIIYTKWDVCCVIASSS